MIIGIYNIQPKEGCYLAEYMMRRHFILDTDNYKNWFDSVGEETKEGKRLLYELIDNLLKEKGYGGSDLTTYSIVELMKCYPEDCGYVLKDDRLQSFTGEQIEPHTTRDQMDKIYRDLIPVFSAMTEVYPNVKTETEFDMKYNALTKNMTVKLKTIKFTIDN